MSENLTLPRIDKLSCPPGKDQVFLWDAKVRGLGVRCTKAQDKAFVFQGRLGGKALRITIGHVSQCILEDARSLAREYATQIDRGIDPRLEKKRSIRAEHAAFTLAAAAGKPISEAWEAYVEARTPSWGERSIADHKKLARPGYPLASILAEPYERVTARAVETWLADEVKRRPTQAALAYRLFRAFVRWAAGRTEYEAVVNAASVGRQVAQAGNLPKPGAKNDSLQREQLKAWFEGVANLRNPTARAYLQSLLLTGARPGELAELRWSDIDFRWGGLTIRDKVDGKRDIPLTPYVAALLASLPRRSEFVFAGPSGVPARDWLSQQRKVCVAQGIPHVTLHGLRRSFGKLTEWVKAPVGVVAQLMGHKPSAIAERHYRDRPIDLLRVWHTEIEAWILEQAGIEQPKQEAGPTLKVVTAA
jgi:integrase